VRFCAKKLKVEEGEKEGRHYGHIQSWKVEAQNSSQRFEGVQNEPRRRGDRVPWRLNADRKEDPTEPGREDHRLCSGSGNLPTRAALAKEKKEGKETEKSVACVRAKTSRG